MPPWGDVIGMFGRQDRYGRIQVGEGAAELRYTRLRVTGLSGYFLALLAKGCNGMVAHAGKLGFQGAFRLWRLRHNTGNSEVESLEETKWEWDEGGWDSSEQEKDSEETDAERVARTEALRGELREKFIRAAQAVRENEARAARLAAEDVNQTAPDPAPAPFSGNSDPTMPTIRIGGRIVEG